MVGVLVDVHVGHLVAGVAAQGPVAGLSGPRGQLPVRRGAAGEAALMVRGARERGRGARARPQPPVRAEPEHGDPGEPGGRRRALPRQHRHTRHGNTQYCGSIINYTIWPD